MNKKKFVGTIKIVIFFLLFIDIFTFFYGYHRVDICQNMNYVNSEIEGTGIKFFETSIINNKIDGNLCYNVGIFMMLFSFEFLIFLFYANEIIKK